jgi:O-succinylbenzoic acid--CoA ligase
MDLEEFLAEWYNDSPYVRVHTSGSTGAPKSMLVEKRRMEASARITCEFLGLKTGDSALLCLPLDYIAGKMMVVRALTCGLCLISVEPSSHPLAPSNLPQLGEAFGATTSPQLGGQRGAIDFAAMVPMQVWNLLQLTDGRERLMQIRHLIIGGGAIDSALASALKDFPNHIWSTYGMTETLSHIALRRLNGPEATAYYTPFEGAHLSQDEEGCLIIDAPAVHDGLLVTNDIAELKPDGAFRILGRRDNVICSGGIKIQAEEVERVLHPHLKAPFCITKRKDPKLGEAVVLLTEDNDIAALKTLCEQELPHYWRPRYYISVAKIPLTETGKIARKEAEALASA